MRQQLAARVGAASKAVVYQWESGKRKPSSVFWLRVERAQAEPVAQADECRCVVRRHGHAANRHRTASTTSIGSSIPRGHEPCPRLSRGGRNKLPEIRSRSERRSEASVVRCGAQRPHVHVEFVSQDLKRYQVTRGPSCLQRLRSVDDCCWRGPLASVPRAECFERDTKSRRALRLGEAEAGTDFP